MGYSSIIRSRVVQKPYQLFHYYFLLEKDPNSTICDLSFETDIKRSIQRFTLREWTLNEIVHYSFLSSVIFFVFCIFPASMLIKLPILLAFITCFLVPLTSQFFVHALPVFSWLALYFTCGKIPNTWKPPISVKILPAMETIMYGDNLSNVLASSTSNLLDILAWIPYGILHFSAPFVVAAIIFLFGPPTSLRSFGFAFGYVNLIGVMVQVLFPAAPPWYKNLYGLQPADYSMKGSPGGLGRIDEILGFDMYTTAFSNSPVIFGAFPSLHSGCSVMDVLFLCWLFPKFKIVWWGYASWLWWSTMYLTHHYFIDLIAGAVFSFVIFNYTKYTHLPVMVPQNFCRWSYSSIRKLSISECDPLSINFNVQNDIESNNIPNFTYFYSQGTPSTNEPIELSSLTRSRQSSKGQVPQNPSGSISINKAAGVSSSALPLPINKAEVQPETETSSLENGVSSVFDEENIMSVNTSTTSLDMLSVQGAQSITDSKLNYDLTGGSKYNKNR